MPNAASPSAQWATPDDFEQARHNLLSEVPGEIEPGCGEKDREKRSHERNPVTAIYAGTEYERLTDVFLHSAVVDHVRTDPGAKNLTRPESCDIFLHDGTLLRCAGPTEIVKGRYYFTEDRFCTQVRGEKLCSELYARNLHAPYLVREPSEGGSLVPVTLTHIQSVKWARELRASKLADQ